MTRRAVPLLGVALAAAIAACSSSSSDPSPRSGDPFSGGATTVFDATKLAYAQQAANLTGEHASSFAFGHSIFDRNWVTAPATTEDMDGLGPRFNQRSCSACHSHDGRSPPFDKAGAQLGMLFRLSVPGQDEHGGPLGDPTYGGQLRTSAILGIAREGVPHTTYVEKAGTYGDGTPFSLQVPLHTIDTWNFGPPSAALMLSPRVAPFTIGLGLLEAITEADLLANVRTGDPDGVKGRPNHVWDGAAKRTTVGRFGWKANVPTVLDQTAGAFLGDIGITSSLNPGETCTGPMTACLAATSGGTPEIDDTRLAAISLYMRALGVPARRAVDDPTALRGEALFGSFGCASCHTATFQTGAYPELPELAYQTIHPYTDLLLHDMGPDLDDHRPDFEASGAEWRTPPLWGIGLLQNVNGHELLMHDARARGFAEAVLWHGGEGLAARERFRNAPSADRDALLAFLRSL